MGDLVVELGARHGPFVGTLDRNLVTRYAAATNDASPVVAAGTAVSATFPAILVFDAQTAANRDVPRAVFESGHGVHGEHDIVLHRVLEPGETLETWSELSSARGARSGTRVALHIEQFDSGGALVVEQWWTTFFIGSHILADVGAEPPDHTFPEAARAHRVGSRSEHVDEDQAHRYGEVSNDWSAHHFDLAAARRAGVDYVFAHGLCTMAMCANTGVALVSDGDPRRVRRVAVRFASPAPLDEDLTVDLYDAGPRTFAFEATCGAATVVTHGLLELREDQASRGGHTGLPSRSR